MAVLDPVFAALDYGTGGGKCALFDARGRCLAVAREPWTFNVEPAGDASPAPSYSFDAEAFWRAIARCARRALAAAAVPATVVRGVATTAQRLGTVFLDAAGREVYAGPNMDGRGFSGALEIMEKLGLERTVAISGHWPPFVSSLARYLVYRASPGHAAVSSILTLSDWLAWRLTGEAFSEPSNACETLFLDVASRRWSREVLDLFEVDEGWLPRLVEPGTRIGTVNAVAAEQTGFAAGTPVYAGGGDTQCALLGSGVVESDQAAAVLGTTTPVMAVTGKPEFDENGRLWTGCHVLAHRWTVESNAGDTGIAYQWLTDTLGLPGEAGLGRAEEEIAALPPEPQAAWAFVGPQIFDLMSFNPSQALGLLFRMPTFTERPRRAGLLRAMQESIAFAVRANLEQIEALRGRPVETLTLSGGMTRSPTLLGSFARILRRPLRVSAEPDATALGAAVLAATGHGVHASVAEAAAAMVRQAPLEPDERLSEAYDAHYGRWRELYDRLRATSV